MKRKVLGLEITAQSIKIALVKNGVRPELLDCIIMGTPANVSSGGMMSYSDAEINSVALAIKEVVTQNKEMGKGLDSLALCVNNSQTVVRPITLPVLPEKEIKAAVEYELSKSFPGVAKTHAISFKEYTRNKKEIGGIVSFSPLKTLEGYVKLIDALGYRYSYIDVIPNAETKAFAAFTSGKKNDTVSLLCDIGSDSTQFTIIQNNMVKHSRQIPEGDRFLKKIAHEKLDIKDSDYEEFRLQGVHNKDIPETTLNSIFRLAYSRIIEQLLQTIEFYNHSVNDQLSVSEVLLFGGGSIFPKITEYFSSLLGVPVSMITPLDNINVDRVIFLRSLAAIGAAIREE